MKKLTAFNFISLNGYLKGSDGDISWHRHGEEENQFAIESLQSGNMLLFGRKTYEMMRSYWTTSMAKQNDPILSEYMNNADKIVISRKLKNADWKNTKIISSNVINKIRLLKESSTKNITILGSGSILVFLSKSGLIDEFQIMIDPIAIVNGTPIFHKIKNPLNLQLTNYKSFNSGVVLLSYKPC